MRSDLLRTSALALAFVGSVGLAVAQQAPAQNNALVNGALAVPGAPANTDTVPAKFSVKNAADDKLITVAYTFKTLTDDERRAIYQALKDQRSSAFNADGGTEVPPGIELRPVPNNTASRHRSLRVLFPHAFDDGSESHICGYDAR